MTVSGTHKSQASTTKETSSTLSVQFVPFFATTSIQKKVTFDEDVTTEYLVIRKKMWRYNYNPPRKFPCTWENTEKLLNGLEEDDLLHGRS